MWQYIIPASVIVVAVIVVAVIEALTTRDRSRAKKHGETLKRHELIEHYFTEAT